VDGTRLLDAPWPDDLDPADVPFRERAIGITLMAHRTGAAYRLHP
jgi:hypothetical protein